MGQKVNPTSFRTGITKDWISRWFAPKSNYGEFLVEDEKIRRYINKRLNESPPYAAVAGTLIERTREEVKITLRTARPGLVIGPKGAEIDKLKSELEGLTHSAVAQQLYAYTCATTVGFSALDRSACALNVLGSQQDIIVGVASVAQGVGAILAGSPLVNTDPLLGQGIRGLDGVGKEIVDNLLIVGHALFRLVLVLLG